MRGERRLVLLTLALGVTACELAVSTSGLSGGVRPTPDGGQQSSEASTLEASADAGEAAVVDANGSFCDTRSPMPAFCADFDDGPFDLAKWSESDTRSSGKLGIDAVRSTSGTSSLLATATKVTTDDFPPAYVVRTLGTVASIRIEADVFIEVTDGTRDGGRILGLRLGDPSIVAGLHVYAGASAGSSASVRADEEIYDMGGMESSLKDHGPGVTIGFGRWVHVVIAVGVAEKSFLASVDGKTITNNTPLSSALTGVKSGGIVGLYYPNVVDVGWSVRYDNVIIDAK